MKPKKKKSSKEDTNLKKDQRRLQAEKEENERGFDFGGLPDRDLKKNLGCG